MSVVEKIKKTAQDGASVMFTGQAGFIFKSAGGTLLAIDLYLSDCVEKLEGSIGFKRLVPPPIGPSDIVFDGVIATHAHYDHFDYGAMRALTADKHTRLYASYGCEPLVRELGIGNKRVSLVKVGDVFDVGDISVRCVSCDHGNAAPDAFGAVISLNGKRIYVAGDTCLHTEYKEEVLRDGGIDIMIAPINGAYGNLNEADCVELAAAINPKLVVPCHYGMFAAHGGDPWKFCTLAERAGIDHTLLTVGECVAL